MCNLFHIVPHNIIIIFIVFCYIEHKYRSMHECNSCYIETELMRTQIAKRYQKDIISYNITFVTHRVKYILIVSDHSSKVVACACTERVQRKKFKHGSFFCATVLVLRTGKFYRINWNFIFSACTVFAYPNVYVIYLKTVRFQFRCVYFFVHS
jgi:hypothetical protein